MPVGAKCKLDSFVMNLLPDGRGFKKLRIWVDNMLGWSYRCCCSGLHARMITADHRTCLIMSFST